MRFLMPLHPLTHFELQKHYQNEPRINSIYSRDNLPEKIKDGAYVINLDEYADVGTHWITLFCNRSGIVYFDSFGVGDVPDEIKKFVGNKNIIGNIYLVQANNSVMCGYFCIGFIDFVLVGKKLTDFTSMFSPYDYKKNDETDKINLSEQTKFRLSQIIGIEDYFHQGINQRKSRSKKVSKYVTAFDYIEKILIVLSVKSSGVCIISSASVAGAPVGIASASFTLIFSLTTGIMKKLLSTTRNKKKKYDQILMLAKSKLDSIETLVSQALVDMETSHEEFNAIIREKQKYERIKENVRNVSEHSSAEAQENMRLNSVNSRNIASL